MMFMDWGTLLTGALIGSLIAIPFSIVANVLTDPAKRWVVHRAETARQRFEQEDTERWSRLVRYTADPQAYREFQYQRGWLAAGLLAMAIIGLLFVTIGIALRATLPDAAVGWVVPLGGVIGMVAGVGLIELMMITFFDSKLVSILREEERQRQQSGESTASSEAQPRADDSPE
jgi:hypothetical protein